MSAKSTNLAKKTNSVSLGQRFKRALYSFIGTTANPEFKAWKSFFINQSKAKVVVNKETAQSVPAFFRAVQIIAEQIASLPFSIYEQDADGNINENKTHPLYRLLKFRPHPLYDTFVYRETVVRKMLLEGECFVLQNRGSNGSVISREILNGKLVDLYEVEGEYYCTFSTTGAKPYRYSDILHFKMYSDDGIKGKNPMDLFYETFGSGIAQLQLEASFYGNGANVAGVLETDQQLRKEQMQQVLESWQRTNSDNMGGTGMLPFGFKYKKIGSTLQDAQHTDIRKLNTIDVSNLTGVPSVMLGNTSDSSYSNMEQFNRFFVQYVLRVICKRIEAEENSKSFSVREMGKKFVRFNLDGLLRADTKSRAAFYQTMYNIRAMNPNEIRGLENMNSYEGGDEYGMPLASNTKEGDGNGE
tara:strand:+ start:661 stop:1902 length:1242 start_codon:yes stop_codon:yes gene_type:complete